ncbi:PREDICTED: N(G),N(G)-dimethylarginine dimethylaminohydrolase 1-like [Branchiostoma belcheri]|uniref:N(G),N(G)-dimethylarginine dimethylaminohydrolase 1-like n=1 Tax=Branchiostoma belcheri TaxID=7741 RepID=A0A6P5ALM6_BRABE|nr:PREDICTED: N(G),N(G)-dimethylarginine dimethylaminohydrolase 1-like [Branchiostoma belcheri]
MAEGHSLPQYSRAIVRQIPDSIRDHSEAFKWKQRRTKDIIDLSKAREEHGRYTQTLRDLGLEVTVLPADESTPDCPFVEDTCVVVGNRALVTRPADKTRRKEVDCVGKLLTDLGLEINRIQDKGATLEGGDVIFTGKEFFVGASTQSNKAGRKILAETFPEYPVISIPVEPPEFHLKGVVCCAGPGVIAIGDHKEGRKAWEIIRKTSKYTYEPVWIPDYLGLNCIHVNGTVLHCREDEWPNSSKVFAEKLARFRRIELSVGELKKVDAAMSCCSLLF